MKVRLELDRGPVKRFFEAELELMEDGDFDDSMLADGEEGLDYADAPKNKRMKWQLFFDKPAADSLEALLGKMRASA